LTTAEVGEEEIELQEENVAQELTDAVPESIRPSAVFRAAARIA
jgi:hypothetical protein